MSGFSSAVGLELIGLATLKAQDEKRFNLQT